ncbi:flagellar hook-basal body complex protein FliE [Paenibacillus protaetiae]|uniref:Flagellar hook-basal body complex protein FliE n=1 Tax=Paenibacillus protaetiae TaxID=2509456 RepID=A0A4P6EY80_9BACL|nr:flagellar hook-basal body complex protein FliE [Paenibacillus protaetiae]QAY65597.1 flagellar hook-basal body complex protein FliE [Paenibacillus protaetiae]
MIQALALNQAVPVQKQAASLVQSTPAELSQSFGDYLQKALDGVGAQEQNVHTLNDNYLVGKASVTDVLIATQQAELSLQLTSQIRNKVIDAYQEIMRMQI